MDPVIPIKPETMHALLATSYGSPSKWEQLYIPLPALQTPTDILIRVHASDINPADARIAGGEFRLVHHIAFPVKLGFDFSGTVVMVGDAVRNFRVGDQVFGMLWMDRAGSLAEYVVAPEHQLSHKPSNLTHMEAASLPGSFFTAYQTLLRAEKVLASTGGLKGKTILVTAGLSGISLLTIQLAKSVFGAAKVITTVSTSKVPLIPQLLGENAVDQIVDYVTQDPSKAIGENTVDVMFDALGGWSKYTKVMKPNTGLVVSIAIGMGSKVVSEIIPLPFWACWLIDLVAWYNNLWTLSKNLKFEFVSGRIREGQLEMVEDLVKQGKMKPVVAEWADFGDLEKLKKAGVACKTGKGAVGRFVVRILKE